LIHEYRQVDRGTIRAEQWVELERAPAECLARLRPDAAERLLAGYFHEVSRLTLGLIRVRFEGERVEVSPPFGSPVLRFRVTERRQGSAGLGLTLQIVGGLLAQKIGERGQLSLALLPSGDHLEARIELVGYRPRLAGLPLIGRLYDLAQAYTHALHGRSFLRRLAREWPTLTG
jgi:hypothetical protein